MRKSFFILFFVFCAFALGSCSEKEKYSYYGTRGTLLTYKLTEDVQSGSNKKSNIDKSQDDKIRRMLNVMRYRLFAAGYKNAVVSMPGSDSIAVRVPWIGKPARRELKAMLDRGGAFMEWCIVDDEPEHTRLARKGEMAPGARLARFGEKVLLVGEPKLDSGDFIMAEISKGPNKGPVILLRLTGTGEKRFAKMIADNPYCYAAILLDGEVAEIIRLVPGKEEITRPMLTGYYGEGLLRIVDVINRGCMPFATAFDKIDVFGIERDVER